MVIKLRVDQARRDCRPSEEERQDSCEKRSREIGRASKIKSIKLNKENEMKDG